MKAFVESLGGSLWAGVLVLSVLITVAMGVGLPLVLDFSNPWAVLLVAGAAFSIGFANGWRQRGIRVEREEEKAAAAARAAELKDMSVRIEKLPLGEKLDVKTAYLEKSNKMDGMSADLFYKHSAEPLDGIVYAVPGECGSIKLKLTDDARAALDAYPECLDAVPWQKEQEHTEHGATR